MKKLAAFSLLSMLLAASAFAAPRVTLVEGDGDELGVTGNPLKVTVNSLDVSGHVAFGDLAAVDDTTGVYPSSTFSLGLNNEHTLSDTSKDYLIGLQAGTLFDLNANNTTVLLYSAAAIAWTKATNNKNFGAMLGLYGESTHYGTGTGELLVGVDAWAMNESNSNVLEAIGYWVEGYGNSGSGTMTSAYGIRVSSATNDGGGTLTTNYGIKVESQTAGTTDYAIHTNTAAAANTWALYNAGTAKSYFGGNVGIAATSPDMALEVNHATGQNLRLTYNDSDGSATNKADFTLSSSGDLTVAPSGGDLSLTGNQAISGSISQLGGSAGVSLSGAAGILSIAGIGNTNNNSMTVDLESSAVSITLDSADSLVIDTNLYINSNNNTAWGGSTQVQAQFDTAETNDSFKFGLILNSATLGSGNFMIVESADINTNFGVGLVTNPTLRIQSADAATPTDAVTIYHDQTDGRIDTVGGDLVLTPAGGRARLSGAMRLNPQASPPASAASGDIYVDSTPTPDELCFYDGAAWQGISSGTDANCA